MKTTFVCLLLTGLLLDCSTPASESATIGGSGSSGLASGGSSGRTSSLGGSTSGGGSSSGSTGAAGSSSGSTRSAASSSGSSSGGSSGSASTASSSGGSSSGSSGACIGNDCALLPDGGSMIGANCGCEADCCGGGMHCGVYYGSGICEPSCATSADCPEPYTKCSGGACAPVYCAGATGNGSISGPCTVETLGDGMCAEPVGGGTLVTTDAGVWLGVCILAGSAPTGATCGATSASRSDLTPLCIPGDVCAGDCAQGCDPNAVDAGCPAGKSCVVYCECTGPFTACL